MSIFIGHKPSRQHIQALHACKLNNSALLELFEKCLEETKDALIKADETVRIHRLQGQAKVLQEFLEAVEKSPEILERR